MVMSLWPRFLAHPVDVATRSEEDRATAIGNMHYKLGEGRTCTLKKLLARGPTNSQTKQTHKHGHHNNPIPCLGEVNFFRPNPTHAIAILSGGSRTG